MARPSYTEAEVEAISARIRAAALRVFSRDGYAHFSLRAVARELGLSPPALYRYVESKDQLLFELRAEGFRRLAEAFEQAVDRNAEAVSQARGLFHAYLVFASEQPDLYRLMYQLDQGATTTPQWVRSERQRAFDRAAEVARAFVDAGHADEDPLVLVHLWWTAIHGLAALDLAHQLDMGRSRDALVAPLVALLTDADYLRTDAARAEASVTTLVPDTMEESENDPT